MSRVRTYSPVALAFLLGCLLAIGLPLLGPGMGSDDQAVRLVGILVPDYNPWFESMFAPGEWTARLLFGLQAGLGSALLGWLLVRSRPGPRPDGPDAR